VIEKFTHSISPSYLLLIVYTYRNRKASPLGFSGVYTLFLPAFRESLEARPARRAVCMMATRHGPPVYKETTVYVFTCRGKK
jgi:hypothetical protein